MSVVITTVVTPCPARERKQRDPKARQATRLRDLVATQETVLEEVRGGMGIMMLILLMVVMVFLFLKPSPCLIWSAGGKVGEPDRGDGGTRDEVPRQLLEGEQQTAHQLLRVRHRPGELRLQCREPFPRLLLGEGGQGSTDACSVPPSWPLLQVEISLDAESGLPFVRPFTKRQGAEEGEGEVKNQVRNMLLVIISWVV